MTAFELGMPGRHSRGLFGLLALITSTALAQHPHPLSQAETVAIENSNASFVLTDASIPQANPARPTVTIPAHIPPTGYLQSEQGAGYAGASPDGVNSQTFINQTSKIALTTRIMVQSISQPYARSSVQGLGQYPIGSNDPGDLDLGCQIVLLKSVGAIPTVSSGYIGRIRSGTSASLDAGEYSQSALVLLGGDLPKGFHYDSNLLFNEQSEGPIRRAQFGQTLAVSHTMFGNVFKQRLGGTIEISHFTQPLSKLSRGGQAIGRPNAVDLLFVTTYSARPNLIFDASVDQGLTSSSTRWQGSFGFTYLLPHRLWSDRHPVLIPRKQEP